MTLIENAELKRTATGYQWWWHEEKIMLAVTRLRDKSDGLWGRIAVYSERPGSAALISASEFRLLSTQSQNAFATHLRKKVETLEWGQYLEAVCLAALREYEQPVPVEIITGEFVDLKTEHLVKPLLVKHELNMIFGDGGTNKSLLAILLSFLLGHGGHHLGMDFDDPCNVLYLDYETAKETVEQRVYGFQQSFGMETTQNIIYRRSNGALADETDEILQQVLDKDVGLVVVDSYGNACGGDALTQDTVMRTCQALRSLNTTILGIHHIPTEAVKGGIPTPYGSRYWHNYHRWTWWANAHSEGSRSTIGLYHQKHNVGPRHPRPIGLTIEWKDDVPLIKRDDNQVFNVPELARGIPQKDQIIAVLKQGALTVEEITALTGIAAVRSVLHRYKDTFVQVGGSWGLSV